jgi:hypothetical protein
MDGCQESDAERDGMGCGGGRDGTGRVKGVGIKKQEMRRWDITNKHNQQQQQQQQQQQSKHGQNTFIYIPEPQPPTKRKIDG